jgi:hypothetical protein
MRLNQCRKHLSHAMLHHATQGPGRECSGLKLVGVWWNEPTFLRVHPQSNTKGRPPSSLTAQHMQAMSFSFEPPKTEKVMPIAWQTNIMILLRPNRKKGTSSKSSLKSSLSSSLVRKKELFKELSNKELLKEQNKELLRNSQYKKELIWEEDDNRINWWTLHANNANKPWAAALLPSLHQLHHTQQLRWLEID